MIHTMRRKIAIEANTAASATTGLISSPHHRTQHTLVVGPQASQITSGKLLVAYAGLFNNACHICHKIMCLSANSWTSLSQSTLIQHSFRYCPVQPLVVVMVGARWLFSSLSKILGECSTIHSLPALFIYLFIFFSVEIGSRTLIPLFTPGSVYSGSASWDDCDRVFPDMLRVSSFPDRFAHSA